MKDLKKIGKVLNKSAQRAINGGNGNGTSCPSHCAYTCNGTSRVLVGGQGSVCTLNCPSITTNHPSCGGDGGSTGSGGGGIRPTGGGIEVWA